MFPGGCRAEGLAAVFAGQHSTGRRGATARHGTKSGLTLLRGACTVRGDGFPADFAAIAGEDPCAWHTVVPSSSAGGPATHVCSLEVRVKASYDSFADRCPV